MNTRQIMITVTGLLILGISIALAAFLTKQQEPPQRESRTQPVPSVRVKKVENKNVSFEIPITGRLNAKYRMEVFAEVNGTFEWASKPFKEGNNFRRGETLIKIRDDDAQNNLMAQKSRLLTSIIQLMPDLKLDFPESYKQWQNYLDHYDISKPLYPFPEPATKQIKYFIASRGLYEQYYNIKNLEFQLSKYTIEAPYYGAVIESNIDPGTLVRPGQKLGEFINPNVYELEAAVGERDLSMVDIGDSVRLRSADFQGTWDGEIIRISDKIDATTQTAKVFIETRGKRLKEGMYLDGFIKAGTINKVVKVPRKMLVGDTLLWVVRDNKLRRQGVEIIQTTRDEVVVRGLPSGIQMVNEPMPQATEGMEVSPVN